jgi:hypothetical protein
MRAFKGGSHHIGFFHYCTFQVDYLKRSHRILYHFFISKSDTVTGLICPCKVIDKLRRQWLLYSRWSRISSLFSNRWYDHLKMTPERNFARFRVKTSDLACQIGRRRRLWRRTLLGGVVLVTYVRAVVLTSGSQRWPRGRCLAMQVAHRPLEWYRGGLRD